MQLVKREPLDGAGRLLGDCVLFRGLDAVAKDALLARARLRTFKAGETIFLLGSPGDTMMAVVSGQVRISVPSADGREIVLAILQDNDVFAEIAMLDGKPRTAEAHALTACTIATLARRDVLAHFTRHPKNWLSLVEVLCERLRRTDQHVADVAFLRLPVRLAKAMLRMTSIEMAQVPGPGDATIRLSQRELGNFVGAGREGVNKCLRNWQRAGLVRLENGMITIVDRSALEQLAAQA
jgi:CRP/FNR family transcriptional regulator, cyclic AMP receptor protein